jgi:CHASE2 domain-containing sensor protein
MATTPSADQPRLKKLKDWSRAEWDSVRKGKLKLFLKPSIVFVFVLVTAWNVLLSGRFLDNPVEPSHTILKPLMDTAKDLRDVNLNLQMRLYQPMTSRAIPLQNDNVRIVYIDDDAHWRKMYGNIPTDRKELAKLILHAAQWRTKAKVIGLDLELFMPRGGQEDPARTQSPTQSLPQTSGPVQPCNSEYGPPHGTDPSVVPYLMDCDTPDLAKWNDDDALAQAILFASSHHVTVVLASYLYQDHGLQQLPNIFTLRQLGSEGCTGPECTGYGYINLPEDKRQVPTTETIKVSGKPSPQTADSFAYKIAKAAYGSDSILTNPKDAEPGTEVFGTFLRESAFEANKISYEDLSNASPEAEEKCSGHIVLIGGRWRGEEGYGQEIDQHLSPAGNISGVALHATYIEALLAHQISREWPFWMNFSFDIALGLIIFYVFESIQDLRKKTILLGISCLLPVAVAWISMSGFNKYLDFLFPIELYFVHVFFTLMERRFH